MVVHRSARGTPLQAFLISLSTVAIAELGDRTQLLSLLLATRFRKPWPIVAGVLVATIANHAVAGAIGVWFGSLLTPRRMDIIVGISMVAMALWTLKPDKIEEGASFKQAGAFMATLVAFFVAEIGDKTQIATVALAAAYTNLFHVVLGTTCGMMLANVPVIFLGKVFADRLPLRTIRYVAAALFIGLGILFIVRSA